MSIYLDKFIDTKRAATNVTALTNLLNIDFFVLHNALLQFIH